MTPNRVQIRRVDFNRRDGAAGRQHTEQPPGPPVACAVQATRAEDKPQNERETGVEYLTVKFYDDPGVRVRDELVDELGRVLVVSGVRSSSGGAGRTWPVDCEYRPPVRGA